MKSQTHEHRMTNS